MAETSVVYEQFGPTTQTWDQIANKQAYANMSYGNLNSTTFPTAYDPIYNKLIEQISYTMYRRMQILQKWARVGRTAPMNEYPGILREVIMMQRKGENYPLDDATKPTTLNSYRIIDDNIDVRYHATQFRWMYGWTIWDEALRRFSGGGPSMIAQLTEMKMLNCINARNLFVDAFRKKLLSVLIQNVAVEFANSVDISNFATLTQDDAQQWLNAVDALIMSMDYGSTRWNKNGYFMQTPKSRMQMIIPAQYYNNVMRRAFPDTYHTETFQGILPENLILIDTMGNDAVVAATATGTPLTPTFDAHGLNLLTWDGTDYLTVNTDPTVQFVLMDTDCLGVEDNLNQTLFGPKDIEKLATPVRSHYWTKGYVTDLLPCVVGRYKAPVTPTPTP